MRPTEEHLDEWMAAKTQEITFFSERRNGSGKCGVSKLPQCWNIFRRQTIDQVILGKHHSGFTHRM